jgi:hypothetical protein
MLYDYKMPAKSLTNFLLVKENTVALAEWVKEKRGITMTHFCFPDNDNSFLAYGFDLLEDKYLTEYTMQVDLTKSISVKVICLLNVSYFILFLIGVFPFIPNVLFSANKGTDFGLLKKVASGGEMSRIMLAVKSILSHYSKLPTIIFDEIDTGVSGEIANKMGKIMKEMSSTMQVFAITHLPQIAAKGSNHYKVFKTVLGDNTVSELKLLTNDERINEIAEMLSGKDISDSALNHAKALLN